MILMSGSSEREIVDLQQGDYEESDRLRKLLQDQGIAVKDSKEGQSWEWII